jgi:hypothetical protein
VAKDVRTLKITWEEPAQEAPIAQLQDSPAIHQAYVHTYVTKMASMQYDLSKMEDHVALMLLKQWAGAPKSFMGKISAEFGGDHV